MHLNYRDTIDFDAAELTLHLIACGPQKELLYPCRFLPNDLFLLEAWLQASWRADSVGQMHLTAPDCARGSGGPKSNVMDERNVERTIQ